MSTLLENNNKIKRN